MSNRSSTYTYGFVNRRPTVRSCPPAPNPAESAEYHASEEVETWRDVVGFPSYEVSDLGRVRRRKTGRILKAFPTCRSKDPLKRVGRTVDLSEDGIVESVTVHALVAAAFIGPRPAGEERRARILARNAAHLGHAIATGALSLEAAMAQAAAFANPVSE